MRHAAQVGLTTLLLGMVFPAGAQAQTGEGGTGKAAPAKVTVVVPPPIAPALPTKESFGPPDATRIALGRKLATLSNGGDVLRAQLDKLVTETLPQRMQKDPQVAGAEQRYPGLVQAMVHAMEPALRRRATEKLPPLIERVGAVYAEEMDTPALEQAIAFFESPAGKQLIFNIATKGDLSGVMDEAAANSGRISEGAVQQTLLRNASGAVQGMGTANSDALFRFTISQAGRLLARANHRVPAIVAALGSQNAGAEAQEYGDLMRAAAEAYVQKYDREHPQTTAAKSAEQDKK